MAELSDSLLQMGLGALQLGQYGEAIAHFEAVCREESREEQLLEAQKHLVIAYDRNGDGAKALILCELLTHSADGATRVWATQMLQSLNSNIRQNIRPPIDVSLEDGERVEGKSSREIVLRPTTSPTERGSVSSLVSASARGIVQVSDALIPRPIQGLQLRQAERAQHWQGLVPQSWWKTGGLAIAQVGSLWVLWKGLAFFFAILMGGINQALVVLPRLEPLQFLYRNPEQWVFWVLVGGFFLSPWLMDGVLLWLYGVESFSLETLEQISPEASRLLTRWFRQQKLPLPILRLVSVPFPVVFSYGLRPGASRIAMSRGMLEQLEGDEIAALLGREAHFITLTRRWVWPGIACFLGLGLVLSVARWGQWVPLCGWGALGCGLVGAHLGVVTLLALVLQVPYGGYRWLVDWGNRVPWPGLRWGLGVLAGLMYGLFGAVRWVGLSVVRLRSGGGDRAVTGATGNPNGLARALLKVCRGVAMAVEEADEIPPILKGLDVLLPVDREPAIALGSLAIHGAVEPLLWWDIYNPYRFGLDWNRPQPPLGDRLARLMGLAQQWQLAPELDFSLPEGVHSPRGSWPQWCGQWAPWLGALGGVGVALLLWGLGWFGEQFLIRQLAWMAVAGDRWDLLKGLGLVGFGLGLVVKVNGLFPDINPERPDPSPERKARRPKLMRFPSLTDVLSAPNYWPAQGIPIQLLGELCGQKGVGNGLGQELFLKTKAGMIRLQQASLWGPVGNILSRKPRPSDWIGKTVTVQGWFRRGVAPWIDIHAVQVGNDRPLLCAHPLWSTLVGLAIALAGIWSLFHMTPYPIIEVR